MTTENKQQPPKQPTVGNLIDMALGNIYGAINVGHPAMLKPPTGWPRGVPWVAPTTQAQGLLQAIGMLAQAVAQLENMPPETTVREQHDGTQAN